MARLSLVVLLLAAAPAGAEVTITTDAGGRVSLRAVAEPLNSVLDQLARKTGMKVVYEGGPPRLPVTLAVEGRTPTEVVLAVLEGQGVNFGLRADESGQRVVNLILAGLGTATASPPPAAAPPGKPGNLPPPPPVPEPFEEETKDEGPDEEVALQPPPQAPLAPVLPTPQTPAFFNSPFAPKGGPVIAPGPTPPPAPGPDEAAKP